MSACANACCASPATSSSDEQADTRDWLSFMLVPRLLVRGTAEDWRAIVKRDPSGAADVLAFASGVCLCADDSAERQVVFLPALADQLVGRAHLALPFFDAAVGGGDV